MDLSFKRQSKWHSHKTRLSAESALAALYNILGRLFANSSPVISCTSSSVSSASSSMGSTSESPVNSSSSSLRASSFRSTSESPVNSSSSSLRASSFRAWIHSGLLKKHRTTYCAERLSELRIWCHWRTDREDLKKYSQGILRH
jgi:hypothetical protein